MIVPVCFGEVRQIIRTPLIVAIPVMRTSRLTTIEARFVGSKNVVFL